MSRPLLSPKHNDFIVVSRYTTCTHSIERKPERKLDSPSPRQVTKYTFAPELGPMENDDNQSEISEFQLPATDAALLQTESGINSRINLQHKRIQNGS